MPNDCETHEFTSQAKLDTARAVVINDVTTFVDKALEDGIKIGEKIYIMYSSKGPSDNCKKCDVKPQENKLGDFYKHLKTWADVLTESKEEETNDEEETDDEEEKKVCEGKRNKCKKRPKGE